MIRLITFLFTAIIISGCSGSIGKLDRAELETEAAVEARKLVKEGESSKAAEILLETLEKDASLARLHLELAVILHESEKDYVGAVYHYRKYLSLRPDSEKRKLIEDRMRIAGQLLAAGVLGTQNVIDVDIEELQKRNVDLSNRIEKLEEELKEARYMARQSLGNRTASNKVTDAEERSEVSGPDGFRRYKVKRGDSLSSIAVKVYNDANKWDQIYEANRRELENSNNLKIGQVLIIP